MPNDQPRPWRMFLPLGIVLVLALLWTVYWFAASGIAKERLLQERQALEERGISLACTQESWGGYPFHFEFSCSSPALTYAGQAELKSARLLLVALAYAPWQVAALLDGPTTLTATGIPPTEIRHQRALGAVTFGKGWQPSFSGELPAASVTGLGTAQRLSLFTRPSASGGTDVALEGVRLVYAPDGKPPVSIASGSLLGTLQAGTTFKIDSFELDDGGLRYWGSGSLSLDDRHRIVGQVDTETNDAKALLKIAAPQLGLDDGKLANLNTMLGLLGNGAKAPIIARDGALYLGPFRISELKPLY